MSYVVTGLSPEPFRPLFGRSDADLQTHGAIRYLSDKPNGFPCRITLRDVEPGGAVLLLNYEHQPADTPFRARHAIFVDEQATEAARYADELPPVFAGRTISLRPFDADGMMLDGVVASGQEIEPAIHRLLDLPGAAYLHAHYAGRGCYAARIERA